MTTAHNLDTLHQEMARRNGRDALVTARETLSRAIQEIDSYLAQFDGAQDDKARSRVINWAIHHLVCNIQPNLRIDLMADAQAELNKIAN